MAEQKKESSSADLKEKTSSKDDDIGKEFLGSWKSMSMVNDDAMDFGFDTVSKSKKKTFDFEKMDMNFDLDGEFDKISSFKVDMSDLDFTCPPKKSSQSTDKKGEASGAKAGKQDGFNFSFDFNELDSFSLDFDTTSNTKHNQRKKEFTTEGNDTEGAKKSKINDGKGVHASNDNIAMKPQASEKAETSKVEASVGNLGNLVSRQNDSVSKFSSSGNLELSTENQTPDVNESVSTEEMDHERDFSEKTQPAESKSEKVINMAPSRSVSQNDSEQDTISEQQKEVFSSGTGIINVSGDKQKVNDKEKCVDSDGVDLQLEHSPPPHIPNSNGIGREATNIGSSTEGFTNDPQPEKNFTSCENIKKTDDLKNNSHDNEIRGNKKSSLECHLDTSSSEPLVDKIVQMKDKELQILQSNKLSIPEDKMSFMHHSSSIGTRSLSFDCNKDADIHLRSKTQARDSFRSNDTRSGSKMVSDSLQGPGKLMRDASALLGSKDDLTSRSNTKEGIVFDATQRAGKLARNMKSFNDEKNRSKAKFQETNMSTKDVNILSSQVNASCLTEKTTTTQISVISQPEASGKESFQKSRITSVEGNKLSSFKVCKIAPALSSLKTLRNIGPNTVLATSSHQKEANSLVNSEQNKETRGITPLKNDHLTDSGDNKKLSNPCLKRKTIEVSEADLTSLRSLKRLSQSPSTSRNSKESLEVVEKVESKPNNFLNYHSTSGLESPSEIKVTEVEIAASVLMEDNSSVEKAESYMKELEDICNMLKKKHEEAKELLVRAIVNNNNLLMLNHPIYDEEFQKVQKFASQLMSKGIQT